MEELSLYLNPQRQGEGGEGGDVTRGKGDGQRLASLRPQSPPVCHLQPVVTRFPGRPLYPLSCEVSASLGRTPARHLFPACPR